MKINDFFLRIVIAFLLELWYWFVLPKEATRMYDYMRTLQKQFEPKPEFFQNLYGDIRQIHKQLTTRMEPEDRKLLLKLIDLEDLFHSEATLHSFISGYRLACCIHRELAEDPMSVFEKDEELRKIQVTIPNAGDALPNQRLEP